MYSMEKQHSIMEGFLAFIFLFLQINALPVKEQVYFVKSVKSK